MKKKRIGILTSGGDCAGLNAAIRSVVHRAISKYGWDVYGILDGSMGLIDHPCRYRKLELDDFTGSFLRLGGTILGTYNKGFGQRMQGDSFQKSAELFAKGLKELKLDVLVVLGGNGSMGIISQFCKIAGVPMIGIPKTIDNDTPLTEMSIGFSTAVEVCVEALDRLYATAASHHRVMILEVMGRNTGHIALSTAIAGGADVVLIPEIPYSIPGILQKLKEVEKKEDRHHGLIVVAEGVRTERGEKVESAHGRGQIRYGGIGHYLSTCLSNENIENRVTVLGHVQRGGIPTAQDRMMASAFGVVAVDLIAAEKKDRMLAWREGKITDVPLSDVAKERIQNVKEDSLLIQSAQKLGIYVGETKLKNELK